MAAAVIKPTDKPFWQADSPNPRTTWVFPVPLLPTAITFSRRAMYSQRASSSTNVLLIEGIAVKSKLSRLFTVGNRASLMRRSTVRCSRSISSSSARRAMESFLAALSGHRGDDATAKAQDVMYDAWERTTSRSRIALTHKALGISPLCADAYVLLAEETRSIKEARDYYAKGVEAGELALGPEGFKQYAGHFWGFLETRPYMRARAGLAGTLLKLGDIEGALSHYRDMLKLNPNDNQGIRYVLAGCLLRQDNYSALKELLAAHEDESAFWLYTQALIPFRESGDSD